MSCPTCDHTMHSVGAYWFWCPRCGTLKQQLAERNGHVTTCVPLGVELVRAWLKKQPLFVSAPIALTFEEAFMTPLERKEL